MRIPAGGSGLTSIVVPTEARAASSKLHAIIAGAGIGGLAAALALARAGLKVTVLERTPVIEEIGAGLQLSPNCSGILREYGVLDRLGDCTLMPEALSVRRARDGAQLMRMPLGVIAEMRWGAPYVLALRGDLQRALVEQVARESSISLKTDMSVAGFAATSDGVEIAVKSGDDNLRLVGDVLIGADGLHSIVREHMGLGTSDVPLYSGQTAWRTLIDAREAPLEALRLETSLWLGHRSHLVHYPLRGGSIVNVVAITEDSWRGAETGDYWSAPADKATLLGKLGRWHGEARALIEVGRDWRRWPLFDRHPVARWTFSRIALLGDAAHPLLPFLAQGAAQAIEDAHALGQAFARHSEVTAALQSYEAERSTRAGAIQTASRRQGRIYHLPAPAAHLRDLGMRMLGPASMLARYDWLYQYHS